MDFDRYERKLPEYRRQFQVLADLKLEINRKFSKERLHPIQDCDTVHERLIKLKKHLAPDAATRCHELMDKYTALKVAPFLQIKSKNGSQNEFG